MKKAGVLGSGAVGKVLASALHAEGYSVMIGTNDDTKAQKLRQELSPEIQVGNFKDTAAYGDFIVLAVKGLAAEAVMTMIAGSVKSKVIIDTTNPIADKAPVNGVLQYYTDHSESLMEKLQSQHPDAFFVKAFSSVGSAKMYHPDYGSLRPSMFICGDHTDSKRFVSELLDRFGWDTEDMGSAVAARAIEPLAMLWCIPGFLENKWTHAFKLLK